MEGTAEEVGGWQAGTAWGRAALPGREWGGREAGMMSDQEPVSRVWGPALVSIQDLSAHSSGSRHFRAWNRPRIVIHLPPPAATKSDIRGLQDGPEGRLALAPPAGLWPCGVNCLGRERGRRALAGLTSLSGCSGHPEGPRSCLPCPRLSSLWRWGDLWPGQPRARSSPPWAHRGGRSGCQPGGRLGDPLGPAALLVSTDPSVFQNWSGGS